MDALGSWLLSTWVSLGFWPLALGFLELLGSSVPLILTPQEESRNVGKAAKKLFLWLDPFGQIAIHQEAGFLDHCLSAA